VEINNCYIVHTENKTKLTLLLEKLKKNNFSFYLHSFNYAPWEDENIKSKIVSFTKYNAFITNKKNITSIIEIIQKVKEEKICILDENDVDFSYEIDKITFLKLNLDTNYQTIKWFINDIKYQLGEKFEIINDNSNDAARFFKKINSPTFKERIIYVDGGMGDHVMVLPLIEKLSPNIYVSCKYPHILEHIPLKGFIHWNDELFGGYRRFVYEYGSSNNSKTIIDAFFEMYGETRLNTDSLKYNGIKTYNSEIPKDKKIALICTSAAKINGQDSNKDWNDVRWLKLVHELKKNGYYVIQAGTKKDNQIPNVDYKFLDKSISELAGLIDESSLWITVDTFFHHFASAIKPEVGICLTPFYNDHAKHLSVKYIEKDCGKNYYDRRWWLDLQQPERKECMDLIELNDVIKFL
jgi:hypothetical protein